jgi:biotin-(acetyl-CoA carboxylase) ligase
MPLWGRRVRALVGPRVLEGTAHDLAEDGGLVLRLDSGAGAVVHAGDVRVDWGGD